MGLKEKLEFNKNLKAAKKGNPMYQCNVGNCYRLGRGVDQNFAEALNWFYQAAKQKYNRAWYYIGLYYENGQGVNKDLEFALQCYFDAEALGYLNVASDIFRLCSLLKLDKDETFFFNHAEKIYKKTTYPDRVDHAINFYTKAAEMGHAPSQDMLGYIYKNEEYNRNYGKSYEWSLKAAKQGNASSLYRVGLYIEKGIYGVVEENPAEALKWYEKAAAQGNIDAKQAYARLKPTTPSRLVVSSQTTSNINKSTISSKPSVNSTIKQSSSIKSTMVSKPMVQPEPVHKENINIDTLMIRVERAVKKTLIETYEYGEKVELCNNFKVLGSPLKDEYGEIKYLSESVISYNVIGYQKLGKKSSDHYNEYIKFSKRNDVYEYGTTAYQLNKNCEIIDTWSKSDAEERDKQAMVNSGWHKFFDVATEVAYETIAKYNVQGRYKSEYYPIKKIKVEFRRR